MHRAQIRYLIGLVFLSLSLGACGPLGQQDRSEVNLTDIFPQDLPAVGQAKRLDVDGDGTREWLVFYHIDLVKDNLEGSPIAAAVYRPVNNSDSRLPPRIVPTLLWLPSQGYLCLHSCKAEMQDVISGEPQGKELLIRDKRGDDTVGLAIFRWQDGLATTNDPEPGTFISLGHFRADAIEIEKDKVLLTHGLGYRSDLATREVYVPQAGHYYRKPVSADDGLEIQLRPPQEAEIVFALGPLKDPASVKLPEKLVMAFYQNFKDLDEITKYVTSFARGKVANGCPPGVCGCTSRWKDVSQVQVKQIAYETVDKPTVSVVVQVRCVRKGGRADPLGTVTWTAQRQNNGTWRLTDVLAGGGEYLCGSLGCGEQ